MMKRFSVLRWTIETSVDLVDSHCPGAAPAQARIESDRASDAGLYYGIGYGLVWVLLMLNQGSPARTTNPRLATVAVDLPFFLAL